MENIGYFLQAAKNYGLTDTVLFITIDLFEERDLERVRCCISLIPSIFLSLFLS